MITREKDINIITLEESDVCKNNRNDFRIDMDDNSVYNQTNSLDFFNFKDNNLDNTYFLSSENKLLKQKIMI